MYKDTAARMSDQMVFNTNKKSQTMERNVTVTDRNDTAWLGHPASRNTRSKNQRSYYLQAHGNNLDK